MSAEGTFVRACVESFVMADEGESVEWGYPGFRDASPRNIDDQVREVPSEVAVTGLVGTSVFSASVASSG